MFATWDYCLSPGSSAERSSVFFFMEPSFFLIEACAVDSAGSFLPQSLVCRTVHKLPAALTPDMCNPHVSTQTSSSSGRAEGEPDCQPWFKTASPSGLMEIFLKMKPELLSLQQYNNVE